MAAAPALAVEPPVTTSSEPAAASGPAATAEPPAELPAKIDPQLLTKQHGEVIKTLQPGDAYVSATVPTRAPFMSRALH